MKLKRDQFIAELNSSDSWDSFVKKTGYDLKSARVKASILRKHGYDLKYFRNKKKDVIAPVVIQSPEKVNILH